MADTPTLDELTAYYVNLLIIQYNRLPKARAHIGALVRQVLVSAVMFEVLNGYDIDTAVGKQLDILGKYVGVDRYFQQIDLENYFSFSDYSNPDPEDEARWGFATYATYGAYSYNGTLTYGDIVEQKNTLVDDDFRIIIKLAIEQNTNNYSQGSIDRSIAKIFGTQVHEESTGNMLMWYFINDTYTPVIQAAISKKLLLKPMAVRMGIVNINSDAVFAFTDYSGAVYEGTQGFSDYSNYGTLSGQVLTYDVMSKG